MVTIDLDQEKCTGCGACVTTCPVGVYELRDGGESEKSHPINPDQCIVCRACEVGCPATAIKVVE